jgi:hypothetical protein
MTIRNVRGLNDNAALGNPTAPPAPVQPAMTPQHRVRSCPCRSTSASPIHRSDFESDQHRRGVAELSQRLPLFLISGCPNPFSGGQPESFYTTDPGKALMGIVRFPSPQGAILRALAAHLRTTAPRRTVRAGEFLQSAFRWH